MLNLLNIDMSLDIKNWFLKQKYTEKALFISFLVFSVGYIAALKLRPYPLSYIVKIIPVLSLAIMAIRGIPGGKGKIIFTGLILSAAGDFFLALEGNYFVTGLTAFAAAHIMYCLAFFRNPALNKKRITGILAFFIYGIAIWGFLSPNLGKFMIPVSVYIVLITSMGISTVAGRNNNFIVIAGAVLFVCSDSLIAVNVFLQKINNSSLWIMLTYFPAQFLITYGAITGKKEKK